MQRKQRKGEDSTKFSERKERISVVSRGIHYVAETGEYTRHTFALVVKCETRS